METINQILSFPVGEPHICLTHRCRTPINTTNSTFLRVVIIKHLEDDRGSCKATAEVISPDKKVESPSGILLTDQERDLCQGPQSCVIIYDCMDKFERVFQDVNTDMTELRSTKCNSSYVYAQQAHDSLAFVHITLFFQQSFNESSSTLVYTEQTITQNKSHL